MSRTIRRRPLASALLGAVLLPLALAGCSSRKGEMMSGLRHYLAKPGNELAYCAILSFPGQSTYRMTVSTTFSSYYDTGFAKSITPDHPVVYVTPPAGGMGGARTAKPLPPLLSYWLKHHLLAVRTASFHDGSIYDPGGPVLSPVTVYVWKHRLPKGLGGVATIAESTGKSLNGLIPASQATSVEVPWLTSYCGGRVRPVKILRFTKPTATDGVTISKVRVALAVHGLPSWFYSKAARTQLGRGAPRKLMTGTVVMAQESSGWSVRNVDDLVPLIGTRHEPKFRRLAASGGLGGGF